MAQFVTRIRTHVLMAKSQVVVLTYPGAGGLELGSLGPTSPTYLTSSTPRGDSVSKKRRWAAFEEKHLCLHTHVYASKTCLHTHT